MVVAVPNNTYEFCMKNKEYNYAYCYVGPTKKMLKEKMTKEGVDVNEFSFFTDKMRG